MLNNGGIHTEQPKLYCVRFTMLNNDYIYLEHNLYHYNKDEAVELARFIISNSLDIHPHRLCLSSITEE